MITIHDYYMGRDSAYRAELTAGLQLNAKITVDRANALVARMPFAHAINPKTQTIISSGWRPLSVNAATKGAATHSKHTICAAVDIYDPDGKIDKWCMANLTILAEIGLWLEHPDATAGWSHWQIVPPRSGRRVFRP